MANKAIYALTYGGDSHIFTLPYGVCSTAAATAAKTVAVQDGKFSLETGVRVLVKFSNTNTATSPTLNVSGTGAKSIYYRNSAISAGYLAANRIYEFVYDGSQYELIGDINTNTTTTTGTTNKTGTKLFLAGATSQASAPTTYSNNGVYIGTDNCLYSNGTKVATINEISSNAPQIGDVKIAYAPQNSNWLKCKGQFLNSQNYPELLASTGPLYPDTITGTQWGDLGEYYPQKLYYINGYFVSVGYYYYSSNYTVIFYSQDFKNWNNFQLVSYKYGDSIYYDGKLHIVVSGGSSSTGVRIYSSSTPWNKDSFTNIVVKSSGKYTVGGIEKFSSGWMIYTSISGSSGPNTFVSSSLNGTWTEKRVYDTAAGITDALTWGHCLFKDKYIVHNWNSNNIQVVSYDQTVQLISFSDVNRTVGCFTHGNTLFLYCTTGSTFGQADTVYGTNQLILKRTTDLTNWTTDVIGPYLALMPNIWSYLDDNHFIFCENSASNTRKSRIYYYNFITNELKYTNLSSVSIANFLIYNDTFYMCYPTVTNSTSTKQCSLTFPLDSFQVPNLTDASYWIKVK